MAGSTTSPENLSKVFKAYDVRGIVGEQLDEELARATGAAYVAVLGVDALVIGYDMRPSSPALAGAFADGATTAGADVTMIGLASTDQLYFASGHLNLPGAMFTASHNPAQYNGIKMCRALAQPVGMESGLADIRDRVAAGAPVTGSGRSGSIGEHDVLQAYAAHLLSLAPVTGRRLKVVVDAGNGMAGHTAPAVFERLADQVEMIPMYFELDGTFPNHEANPIEPANLVDLQKRVISERADIGLAFDGDADRCFLVDERGELVSPSTLTALIAARELAKEPGATVIHNLITSRAVPEIVTELGGTPVRTRVGHSYIKATMAETDAIFGGEHSGHFYFRDFWRADSGMLAALHAMAALAETDRPLSELLRAYERYPLSGEINSTVADQDVVLRALEAAYVDRDGVTIDRLDGLSVGHADWAFNVRASNTEPLLRLNAEGKDEPTMARVRDEALAIIRSGK
ncbi:phosphomannomutase/phosphoglucomutase [Pimelobacter simplex]|uniref:Phosphomannomutase n=1 Tax=Nocardioides simplex TaxID=2045 RepID=A0A0A1DM58_NOCSI|nr:phosphomannomutase/phosphoglucomutase [Pimelobacter simplex]AIY18439.1 Phosphomannomutase [Pimelobacter simplex]MCG8153850.1 phosphomannomutase/phosphoglucomutase [Pimelobacter simplex]GEB16277.1 phosphomannomutase/phosphoglucomutase [Pimelobacter simplex]SFM34846.1 phosphomannomutase [Pimelobacter simplex]